MEFLPDLCWDETALRAMRKTFNYLRKNASESVALKFKNQVFEAVETLLEHPERYAYDRLLLENPPRYRSIPVNDYRIVYEFKQNTIFILLIYHSRQNPEKVKKAMP